MSKSSQRKRSHKQQNQALYEERVNKRQAYRKRGVKPLKSIVNAFFKSAVNCWPLIVLVAFAALSYSGYEFFVFFLGH